MKRLPNLIAIILIVSVAFAAVGFGIWEVTRALRVAERNTEAIARSMIRLERSIGYVGLIHHFKNAVLRPDEPEYLALAEESYGIATSALANLQDQLVRAEIEVDASTFKMTIDRYGAALSVIQSGHERGLSVPEVDQLVRIDDLPAHTNLSDLETRITELLQERERDVRRQVRLTIGALFLLTMLALIAVEFMLRQRRRQEEFDRQRGELARNKAHADELARLVTDLERSNRELDEFAYIASHDLKEPLRGIGINANFLLREDLPGKVGERITRMSELTGRMEQLISDLLSFSRIGRTEGAPVVVRPGQLIAEIREDLSEWLAELDGEIVETGQIPALKADSLMVKTALQNLIVNGIKYNNSEKRRVELGFVPMAEVNGQMFENAIFVKDNGIGIGDEYRDKIFRIFSRLNKTSDFEIGSERGMSSGSGLAFVRKIVERLGGKIDFVSRPQEGTTFYLTFPLANGSEQPIVAG